MRPRALRHITRPRGRVSSIIIAGAIAKCRSIILPTLSRIAATIGLDIDSKVALGLNEWELIYKRLTDGTHLLAHEGGYDPATIKQWFSIFTRCAVNRESINIV